MQVEESAPLGGQAKGYEMRLRAKAWRAALLAPAVLLLAGCSGGSIVPRMGTDGGLGTIGTDTGNPDEALVMRVKGSALGDFVADTVGLLNPPDPRVLQAKQETGRNGNDALRTIVIQFGSAPVEGHTYTVGASGADSVDISYAERKPPSAATGPQWSAASGTVKVTRLDANRIEGTFSAALTPFLNGATGNLSLTGGAFRLKF
jgi:hypothetical protein